MTFVSKIENIHIYKDKITSSTRTKTLSAAIAIICLYASRDSLNAKTSMSIIETAAAVFILFAALAIYQSRDKKNATEHRKKWTGVNGSQKEEDPQR